MKSKSLQLQSNKSRKEQQKHENNKKVYTALYVLYLFFLGNVSDVVPLVAGWRETKLKCTIGLLGKKKNLQCLIFLSEQYQSEYHCYSKCFALFRSEARDSRRRLSLTSLASQWEWGGGGGVSTECLSAVVLWVSSGSLPTVQHFLLSSTWPLPQSHQEKKTRKNKKKRGTSEDWPITALRHRKHLQQRVGWGVDPWPRPHLSALWHKDHFSWKML